jgi:hypothetical protein
MVPIIYPINRGINRTLEFRGLKAQYIWYGVAIVVGDMILFAFLYICHCPPWLCLIFAGVFGGSAMAIVFFLSNKFGQYGLMKRRAAFLYIPAAICCHSCILFIHLNKQYETSEE